MKKILIALIATTSLCGCCKDKPDEPVCSPNPANIVPFKESFGGFWCNDDTNYLYIFRKKEQIDSLYPHCFFVNSMAFPIDDTNMVYIMFGKTSYHYKDTFETMLLKDTCLKTFTYDVRMMQTDTAYNTFPGALQIYCSVENIPANYQVEVKYQYIPK